MSFAVATPSLLPEQDALVSTEAEAFIVVGAVIVTVSVSIQPLSSSTVTVKVPAHSPVVVAEDPPLLHEYE